MKSKYNIFKGALDLGFFHVKFQEAEYMILSEQGRVFSEVTAGITNLLQSFDLVYWGYLVPFKMIIEGIRLANTWSHLEGVPSFSAGMVRTLDSLFAPINFSPLAGDFKLSGQLLTACLLALSPTLGGQI